MTELWDPALADNLHDFVMFAYPWGKAGTPLENFKGPRNWQRDDLYELTEHIQTNKARLAAGQTPVTYKKATGAGRGPGKSALISWLAGWNMTCHIGSTTVVTANTEPQLKSRTFAEITRWSLLLINAHWFETSVLSMRPAPWFQKAVEDQLQIDTGYYYAQGQLWSEESPDAFAGVHSQYGMMLLMDEGSGIPNSIFNVSEGFFTEPILHRYWAVFSNLRRNSGALHDVFQNPKVAATWGHRHIDIRTVDGIDLAFAQNLIDQYGIDSDIVRVEVLGQFPKTGSKQFISNTLVYDAQQRELVLDPYEPLIMGVDPARFGDDEFVVRFRQGRDARSIPPVRWKGLDTMASAARVGAVISERNPDAVCIDSGAGGGVIDILRSRGFKVHEIHFGGKAKDNQWANKRTEMAAECRNWLPGGCIDNDPNLFSDLTSVDYDYYGKAKDQQILEPKEVVKGKIGRSPGDADAFWLTFAIKVARRDLRAYRAGHTRRSTVADDVEESYFGLE